MKLADFSPLIKKINILMLFIYSLKVGNEDEISS